MWNHHIYNIKTENHKNRKSRSLKSWRCEMYPETRLAYWLFIRPVIGRGSPKSKTRCTRCKFPCGIACGEPCWLPCGLRSGKMTSRLTAVRAGVRDFGDRTSAIFPACFLAGWAGEPVRSKKNVEWFSWAGIAKDRWLKYDIKFYTGAPVVGTPILGTHYIVSCDAEVCGAERESSRTIQGRMHWAVYFALLCFASSATLG